MPEKEVGGETCRLLNDDESRTAPHSSERAVGSMSLYYELVLTIPNMICPLRPPLGRAYQKANPSRSDRETWLNDVAATPSSTHTQTPRSHRQRHGEQAC